LTPWEALQQDFQSQALLLAERNNQLALAIRQFSLGTNAELAAACGYKALGLDARDAPKMGWGLMERDRMNQTVNFPPTVSPGPAPGPPPAPSPTPSPIVAPARNGGWLKGALVAALLILLSAAAAGGAVWWLMRPKPAAVQALEPGTYDIQIRNVNGQLQTVGAPKKVQP
jgi:hypothetical protein